VEHSKCIQHVSVQLISWETHCKFDWRTWGNYNLGTFQMYPACSSLGKLESHGRGHLKCTQPIPTGHIGVTCCLYSQCIQHVPGGYLGPCPQCHDFHRFPPFSFSKSQAPTLVHSTHDMFSLSLPYMVFILSYLFPFTPSFILSS